MGRTKRTLWNTIIYMVGLLTSRGAALFLVPLYTRVIDPAGFALWDLCVTTVMFLNPLFNLGLQSAVMRYYFHFDTYEEQRRAYNTGLCFLVCTLLMSLALFFGFAEQIARFLFKDSQHANLIKLVALMSAATALSQQPMALLRAQERSFTFSILQLARGTIGPAVIILLVVKYRQGVSGILLGEIAGITALVLAGQVCTWRWLKPSLDLKMLKPMLAFGLPLLPMGIGGALLAVSDKFILRAYVGLEEMAPYSLGFKVGMGLSLVIQALQLSWQPAALQLSKQPGGRGIIAKSYLALQLMLLCIAVAVSCFAPELVRLLAPDKGYAGAERIIPWIVFSFAIHGCVYLLTAGIGIAKKTIWASIIFCAAGAIKVALAFAFIPHFGIMGAAVTTLVAFSAEFVMTYFVVQRIYPLPLAKGRIVSIFVLSALALAGVLATLGFTPWTSFGLRMALMLGYFCICYFAILTKPERQSMWVSLEQQKTKFLARFSRS